MAPARVARSVASLSIAISVASCGGGDESSAAAGAGGGSPAGAQSSTSSGVEGCKPGSTEVCYTGPDETKLVGACKHGTRTCLPDGSGYGACEGEVLPGTDDCRSGLDGDCDGHVAACETAAWSLMLGSGLNGSCITADFGRGVHESPQGRASFFAKIIF